MIANNNNSGVARHGCRVMETALTVLLGTVHAKARIVHQHWRFKRSMKRLLVTLRQEASGSGLWLCLGRGGGGSGRGGRGGEEAVGASVEFYMVFPRTRFCSDLWSRSSTTLVGPGQGSSALRGAGPRSTPRRSDVCLVVPFSDVVKFARAVLTWEARHYFNELNAFSG